LSEGGCAVRKSGFVTFVLSIVPGLGHVYLGLPYKGMGLMAIFFGWIFCLFVLTSVGRMHGGEALLFLAPIPVIWFYSMFDALILNQRINEGEKLQKHPPLQGLIDSIASGKKDTVWALLFGIVPGAGQMYLGWQDRGLHLMLLFFLCVSLVDWLRLNLFLFMLPVIWFYSFFDTMQLASRNADCPPPGSSLLGWVAQRQRWVGIGLISLGCVVLFDRIVAPLLHFRIVVMMRTAIVAALLIGGGIRLAMGRPVKPSQEQAGSPDQPGLDAVIFNEDRNEDKNEDKSGGAQSCGNGE